MNRFIPCLLSLLCAVTAVGQGTRDDYARADRLSRLFNGTVTHARVDPRWDEDGSRFWYRVDLPRDQNEYVVVDTKTGAKTSIKEKPTWGNNPSPRRSRSSGSYRSRRTKSPDDRWIVTRAESNLRLKDGRTNKEVDLTTDGSPEAWYEDAVYWSPDSRYFVALKRTRGGGRTIPLVESSPQGTHHSKLRQLNYAKPGDPVSFVKPHLFEAESGKEIPVSDELFANPWSIDRLRWDRDSKRFMFLYNQRGHQAMRLVSVDAETGAARALIDDTRDTFFDYNSKLFLYVLEESNELIWMSERSGWNHLYLIDAHTGEVKNPITKGEWVVRGVDRVDVERRQIWFRALGIYPEQDPYHVHYCRVNFDGSGLTILTQGDGTHLIRYSPDEKVFIDEYSRVDLPPVFELRRSSDGERICELERGDWSKLLETGWKAPERFVAKGRDGSTDIHGIIIRPTNFDPEKKYPIVESIYAGPHGAHVQKSFRAYLGEAQATAELGFIVVMIDGMGTNWRSKAFHDVCWQNLADSGFPDRIRWIKAAAQKYPSMDTARVGIYGVSAGGQSSMRALLSHGDFYKVGISISGCHDNRVDKIWWNELWMGWPIGPHYAKNSNVTDAHKLQGRLMLLVGEMDTNVDPISTMQVVDALIKADKDFDLVVVPGGGHGYGGRYGIRRQRDFLVRHLLGVEPRSN